MIVALVVLSAFLHAAWNALLKREPDKDRGLIAAVTVASLVALAVSAVRWAALGDAPFQTASSLGWALVAGTLELTYLMALARALERGALGPVYTISRGGAVVLVYPLSVAIFGEVTSVQSALGSAIVVVGLVASGLAGARPRADHRTAAAWALVCAAAIAGYHLAYKAALDAGGGPSAVFAVALSLATALNYARVGTAGRAVVADIFRRRTGAVLAMGVLCGASFLILMEALAGGQAGYVLTLRNTSVLFATGLAWWLGERPTIPHAVGALLVAAGAAAMAT
nr:hypothetical protein [Kofleriaceae bacterium]